jgi:hypothetical protein
MTDMELKRFQICHLSPVEIGPQELPGVLPGDSVGAEDAWPEQGDKRGLPPITEVEVVEVGRHYGFQIFGIHRTNHIHMKKPEIEGTSAVLLESISPRFQKLMGFVRTHLGTKQLPTKHRVRKIIQARLRLNGLASMFFDKPAARRTNSQLLMDVTQGVEQQASKDHARQAEELRPGHHHQRSKPKANVSKQFEITWMKKMVRKRKMDDTF